MIMNMNEPPSLLRNDSSGQNHWLKVQLEATTSNRSAIGARVTARYGGRLQVQEVMSQSSFLSVNDKRLHFGLGAETSADPGYPMAQRHEADILRRPRRSFGSDPGRCWDCGDEETAIYLMKPPAQFSPKPRSAVPWLRPRPSGAQCHTANTPPATISSRRNIMISWRLCLAAWRANLASCGSKLFAPDFLGASPQPSNSRIVRPDLALEVRRVTFAAQTMLGREAFIRQLRASLAAFSTIAYRRVPGHPNRRAIERHTSNARTL